MSSDDIRHMSHALGLARRGLGRVWPNPSVGCVIVKDGRIVGRARTADGGRPHAETQALEMAGADAVGSVVFVTLEPCSHHGKTPPCVDALIKARVERVVIAEIDPDSRVSGQGVAALKRAGITVDVGCLGLEASTLQCGYLTRIQKKRPSLTLKLAATMDGRIATASGESQWITGPMARRDVHALRAAHDAVLIGAGTARADDPKLTVRGFGDIPQPVRVVASSNLNLPLDSVLVHTAKDVPVWIACTGIASESEMANAWRAAGAKIMPVPDRDGQVAPLSMLRALSDEGLTRVFCEGGGKLAASLLAADVVDELIVYSAGGVIGAEGKPSVGSLEISALSDAPNFDLVAIDRLDNDVRTRWLRRKGS